MVVDEWRGHTGKRKFPWTISFAGISRELSLIRIHVIVLVNQKRDSDMSADYSLPMSEILISTFAEGRL